MATVSLSAGVRSALTALNSTKADAAQYLAFLRGDAAKVIFERYGFSVLASAKAS